MASNITLRPPSTSKGTQPADFLPPSTAWLQGTWNVSYATLPMWKTKRNVQITYQPLPATATATAAGASNLATEGGDDGAPAAGGETDRIDDVVSYQTLHSDKVKTIHGVDNASGGDASKWDWRGKGWLAIASSHWEVLGYGSGKPPPPSSPPPLSSSLNNTATDSAAEVVADAEIEEWIVTYFAKTLFTPAGIDIYSRPASRLSVGIVEAVKAALAKIDDPDIQKLGGELFEVKHDGGRNG
ncbi:MAG: hypothetical protein M1837_006767 [Sclerophora amabilis]|nr:MAG: hypothetical protein M1837_006767 [Sclerophora amabilis]